MSGEMARGDRKEYQMPTKMGWLCCIPGDVTVYNDFRSVLISARRANVKCRMEALRAAIWQMVLANCTCRWSKGDEL